MPHKLEISLTSLGSIRTSAGLKRDVTIFPKFLCIFTSVIVSNALILKYYRDAYISKILSPLCNQFNVSEFFTPSRERKSSAEFPYEILQNFNEERVITVYSHMYVYVYIKNSLCLFVWLHCCHRAGDLMLWLPCGSLLQPNR